MLLLSLLRMLVEVPRLLVGVSVEEPRVLGVVAPRVLVEVPLLLVGVLVDVPRPLLEELVDVPRLLLEELVVVPRPLLLRLLLLEALVEVPRLLLSDELLATLLVTPGLPALLRLSPVLMPPLLLKEVLRVLSLRVLPI